VRDFRDGLVREVCDVFGAVLADAFPCDDTETTYATQPVRRIDECLTAEREHAAMERDARLGKAVRKVATPEQLYHAKEAVRRMQADSIAQHGGSVGSVMVVESCRRGMEMLDAIAAALCAEDGGDRG
jgi:lactam utilization protein B